MTGPPAVPPPDPHHPHVPDHIVRHRKMQTVEEQQIVPLASIALGLPMELPWEYDARRPETKTSFTQLPVDDDDDGMVLLYDDDAEEMMTMALEDNGMEGSSTEASSRSGEDDQGDDEEDGGRHTA